MKTASWMIVEKATGRGVFETFDKATADKARQFKRYEVVPILEYLVSLNAAST